MEVIFSCLTFLRRTSVCHPTVFVCVCCADCYLLSTMLVLMSTRGALLVESVVHTHTLANRHMEAQSHVIFSDPATWKNVPTSLCFYMKIQAQSTCVFFIDFKLWFSSFHLSLSILKIEMHTYSTYTISPLLRNYCVEGSKTIVTLMHFYLHQDQFTVAVPKNSNFHC